MGLASALTTLILVSAVVLTVELAIDGVYSLAVGVGAVLLVYGYLARWGDRPIEKRLLSGPHRR